MSGTLPGSVWSLSRAKVPGRWSDARGDPKVPNIWDRAFSVVDPHIGGMVKAGGESLGGCFLGVDHRVVSVAVSCAWASRIVVAETVDNFRVWPVPSKCPMCEQ